MSSSSKADRDPGEAENQIAIVVAMTLFWRYNCVGKASKGKKTPVSELDPTNYKTYDLTCIGYSFIVWSIPSNSPGSDKRLGGLQDRMTLRPDSRPGLQRLDFLELIAICRSIFSARHGTPHRCEYPHQVRDRFNGVSCQTACSDVTSSMPASQIVGHKDFTPLSVTQV